MSKSISIFIALMLRVHLAYGNSSCLVLASIYDTTIPVEDSPVLETRVPDQAESWPGDPYIREKEQSGPHHIPLSPLPPAYTARPSTGTITSSLYTIDRAGRNFDGQVTEVALKRPINDPRNPQRSQTARRLLANETRVLKALNPNDYRPQEYFPKLIDSGPDYLATSWETGRTLRELVQSGQLTPFEVERILDKVRKAVEAMHSKNLVHADLKPENILIKNDGSVVILDFGITVYAGQKHLSKGTSRYAHPDQKEGAPAQFSHDWHSFAVMGGELREAAHSPSSSLDSYQSLAKALGLDLETFRKGGQVDWRAFHQATRLAAKGIKISEKSLQDLRRLSKEFDNLFTEDHQIKPLADLIEGSGETKNQIPLPREFNRFISARDRSPLQNRKEKFGTVSWFINDRKLSSDVLVSDSVPVRDLLAVSSRLDKNFLEHLASLPENAKIKTVKTRIYRNDDNIGKFEFHVIEYPNGKKTLVIDKAFTDLSHGNYRLDENLSNGMFGALQAARALLTPSDLAEINEVKIWEVANFETVLSVHDAERKTSDKEAAHQNGMRGSLMANFADKIISGLGLEKISGFTVSGGKYVPIGQICSEAPRIVEDPNFGSVPFSGRDIAYDYNEDARVRRNQNRARLNQYRTVNRDVTDTTEVFTNFDVAIPVRSR